MTVLVVLGLAATACSNTKDEADRSGTRQAVADAKVTLADLAALKAPPDDGSPRGLVGAPWSVSFPTSADRSQSLGIVGSTQPLLGTAPGTYEVRDALGDSDAPSVWKGAAQVPAGKLVNGRSYSFTYTPDGGTASDPVVFTVAAGTPVGGAFSAQVEQEPFTSSAGSMGLGLTFTTADVGTSKALVADNGVRDGLPVGWMWQGLGSGLSKVVVEDASGYRNFKKVVEIHRDGGDIDVLGCIHSSTWGCTQIVGGRVGQGFQAVLSDDAASTVTVTDAGGGRTWTFATYQAPAPGDPSNSLNRLEGHVIGYAGPGVAPVAYYYDLAKADELTQVKWDVGGGAGHELSWRVFRGKDQECAGALPPGFVKAASDEVCGWILPNGDWVRLFYVDTGSDVGQQIGRVLRLPGSVCKPGDYTACQSRWDLTAVTDWAWSATGHPRAMRDASATRAVMAGAVDQGDASMTMQVDYDAQGRVVRHTSPASDPGGARAIEDHAFKGADADFPGSTHEVVTTHTTSDGSVPPLTAATAVDDGLRTVGDRDTTGATVLQVWRQDKDLQAARIGSDGLVEAQTFDAYDRVVGSFVGPRAAFPAATCAPGAAGSSPTACEPVGGRGDVAGTRTVYDDAGAPAGVPKGVPNGLIASWYTDTDFGGAPVANVPITAVDANGALVLTPPAKASPKGGAIRITGALAPADKHVPTSLDIEVTGAPASGSVFVNGRFYGGLNANGRVAPNLDEGTKPLPYRFRADVSYDAAPPKGITITDPDDGFGGSTYAVADTMQRWGAPTEERSIEAQSQGSATVFVATATRDRYDDPEAPAATAAMTVACGQAGAWQAADEACNKAPVSRTVSRTFQDDPFGGRRLRSEKSGEGNVTTYDYWGQGATPSGAGLANAGELPGDVAGALQLGQLQAVTTADGRTVTSVYDDAGAAACNQVSRGSSGGHWSCTSRDALGRPIHQTYRNAEGSAPTVTVDYTYATTSDSLPGTTTRTRSDGGKVVSTETSKLRAGGALAAYEQRIEGTAGAAAVSSTTYRADAAGRPTGATTTVTLGGKSATLDTGQTYLAGSGLADTTTIDGKPAAKVSYDPGRVGRVVGTSYPIAGGTANTIVYGADDHPVARNWTLAGGATVANSQTRSSGGRILGEVLDGTASTYRYDGTGRLVAATIGGAVEHYGWDADANMVCSARGLKADQGDCASDPGKVTNTYTNGRLTATTDPDLALPDASSRYTLNGNLTALGDQKLTYDADEQVSRITKGTTTTDLVRDASGRIITYRDSSADGALALLYATPADATPVATVAPDGSYRFSTDLPGGLLWHTDGTEVLSLAGHPAVVLAPDGTRDPAKPTRQFGPFGNELTAKAAPAPAPEPTTTTTTEPSTTTTEPSTTTTEPSTSTTTTEPSTTTTEAAADATTSTTSAPAPTTTAATTTTTTTAPASTTTTTKPEAAPPAVGPDVYGWNQRMSVGDGLINLGQRTMVPTLGIFTSPDPVANGSCTTYGYTCGDPINQSDVTGTSIWSVLVATAVILVISILVPMAIGAVFSAGAALIANAVATVVIGGASGPISLGITDGIDKTKHSVHDYLMSVGTGAIVGAASAGIALGLTRLTYTEAALIGEEADYAYGVKELETGAWDVGPGGLYTTPNYGAYRISTFKKLLSMAVRCYQEGENLFSNGKWKLIVNTFGIKGLAYAGKTGAKIGEADANRTWGWFS